MSCYELWLPPVVQAKGRDITNGRFIEGNIPYNKGKRWPDYMSELGISRAKKGWKNLKKERKRPDNAERIKRGVIAVDDNGTWRMFPMIKLAALYVGGNKSNVTRCCKLNEMKCKKNGFPKTNHKYKGMRFFYESSDVWLDKIKNYE